MSIADKITSMTNHLEKDYQALESVVGTISVNKNIENIAPLLDNLWEELPKVTGTGESLSLSTRPGKMKVNLLGNTSQTGTPTPDNPIPVNVVSGDNEVVVCGKNLFDKDSITNNYYYDESGNYTSVLNTYLSDYINVISSEEYTFQTQNSSTTKRVNYFDSNKTWISQVHTNNADYSFTTPNNAKYVRISFNANVDKDVIQIEKGNSKTDYEPYQSSTYPIHLGTLELCKIGTYQDKFIRNSGKNLFDGEIESGSVNIDTGQNIVNANNIRTKNYVSIRPNTEYTLSSSASKERWGIYYNESKTYLGRVHINSNATYNATFTTIANAYYIRWYEVNNNDLTTKWQLELGSTATTYEPYGNGDWYLKKELKEVDTNSSTYNGFYTTLTNLNYMTFTKQTDDIKRGYVDRTIPVICNKAKYSTRPDGYDDANLIGKIYDGGDNVYAIGLSKTITTEEQAVSFIGTYKLYYILSSPTYTKITGTLKEQLESVWRAYSYKGQTNINQVNNDLPFELDVTALEG